MQMAPIQVSQANNTQGPTIKQEPGTEGQNSNQTNQVLSHRFVVCNSNDFYLEEYARVDGQYVDHRRANRVGQCAVAQRSNRTIDFGSRLAVQLTQPFQLRRCAIV